VNYWSHVRVRLNDNWGPGAAHSLATPLGAQPEFVLHPRHLRDGQGDRHLAHFSIDFSSGYLGDGWQGVNFVPLGAIAVAGISRLPPWDPSQRDVYRNMITAAAGSLTDSRTLRLEAIVPYLDSPGSVGYNKVRLFFVNDAVQGPIRDLVVIKITTHAAVPGSVQGRQDGDGHGPPH
jgi:hypothetical protein